MPDRSLRSLLFAGCLVLSLCALSITPVVADDTSSAVAPTGDAAPVAPALPTADDGTGARCTADGPDELVTGAVPLFTIKPRPTYCDDCRPCTNQGDCGYDGSSYLGVCSPNPSYCGYPSYSACVCY